MRAFQRLIYQHFVVSQFTPDQIADVFADVFDDASPRRLYKQLKARRVLQLAGGFQWRVEHLRAPTFALSEKSELS